jgi:divalent metal cation (Fe/Co/Zn/Cd) transporter
VGIAVAAVALVVMPLLGWRKRLVNAVIRSPALSADIAETVTCAYLAAITLAGVALNALTGLWWLEYIAALGLLFWLVRETQQALQAAREGRARSEDD